MHDGERGPVWLPAPSGAWPGRPAGSCLGLDRLVHSGKALQGDLEMSSKTPEQTRPLLSRLHPPRFSVGLLSGLKRQDDMSGVARVQTSDETTIRLWAGRPTASSRPGTADMCRHREIIERPPCRRLSTGAASAAPLILGMSTTHRLRWEGGPAPDATTTT
jgi:hypothetical protein